MKIILRCGCRRKSLNLCVYSASAATAAAVVVVYLREPQTYADVVWVWLKRLGTHGRRGKEYLNPSQRAGNYPPQGRRLQSHWNKYREVLHCDRLHLPTSKKQADRNLRSRNYTKLYSVESRETAVPQRKGAGGLCPGAEEIKY